MRLHEHALRRQVVNEMHLRRFARLDPPALAIQTVRLLDDEQWEKEWSVISDLRGAELDRTARHMETGWKDAVRIAWERHSEAITTTLTFATSYVGKQRRVSASRYPCADIYRRGMQSEPDGSHRQRDRSLP